MKSTFIFFLLIILSTIGLSQQSTFYTVKRPYNVSGFGNKNYYKTDLRNLSKTAVKFDATLFEDQKGAYKAIVLIENGEFVVYPDGKKKNKFTTNEISIYVRHSNKNFATVTYPNTQGDNDFSSKIILKENIFYLFDNNNPLGCVTDSIDYDDWDNNSCVLFNSKVKDLNALSNKDAILQNFRLVDNKVLSITRNKWHPLLINDGVSSIRPESFIYDGELFVIKAFSKDLSIFNTTDFDYNKFQILWKWIPEISKLNKSLYVNFDQIGVEVKKNSGNEATLYFILKPKFNPDSIWCPKANTENKFASMTMTIGTHTVYKGSVSFTHNPNSSGLANSNNIYNKYFFSQLKLSSKDEKKVLEIINNPKFNLSHFKSEELFEIKEIPLLKKDIELLFSSRKDEIFIGKWLYKGSIARNLPNGNGTLKNLEPEGYGNAPVVIEYEGFWVDGKKNGRFKESTKFFSALGGLGTVYGEKIKFFKDDIEYSEKEYKKAIRTPEEAKRQRQLNETQSWSFKIDRTIETSEAKSHYIDIFRGEEYIENIEVTIIYTNQIRFIINLEQAGVFRTKNEGEFDLIQNETINDGLKRVIKYYIKREHLGSRLFEF